MKFLLWLMCVLTGLAVAAAVTYCKQNGGACVKDSNCCSGKCNPRFQCGLWKVEAPKKSWL